MDDRERILADTPCRTFELVPCFRMGAGLKVLRMPAHVAADLELSVLLRHHAVVPFAIRPIVASSARRFARAALPPRDPVMVGRATGALL